MKKLIFFDINGTLIARDARTDLPFGDAVNELLGTCEALAGVNTAARSDQDVFMEILKNHQLTYTEALWEDFLARYKSQLENYKQTDVWRPNADAIPFVEKMAKTNHLRSLITGELTMGAAYKLSKLGIWQHFPTGGFGEHGLKRFDIATYALQAAKAHYGLTDEVLSQHELYVIGDTCLDIQTARHIGAKAIAITTGSNNREELAALNPDYLIDQFSELDCLFF